jgi:hypothetical protein
VYACACSQHLDSITHTSKSQLLGFLLPFLCETQDKLKGFCHIPRKNLVAVKDRQGQEEKNIVVVVNAVMLVMVAAVTINN